MMAPLTSARRGHAATEDAASFAPAPLLHPIQARADRIIDISVCTRPFRAQGPRIEAEQVGRQTVIHNYGHGGSGWSLSWGSAQFALQMALATREKRIAVIGCGAIGLSTARAAQRAGLRVRILCRDRPPEVRSSAATGVWSPASRICTEEYATPAFAQRWEMMARHSYKTFQNLLGLPGEPVEWCDNYVLFDEAAEGIPGAAASAASGAGTSAARHGANEEPAYPDLMAQISDLRPRTQLLARGQHPFPVLHARRASQMVFNLPAYQHLLLDEFMRDGGEIEQRDFSSPRQFAALRERTVVNATGYGARGLLGDHSITPVRGQTARLVPQPEARYGLNYVGHNVAVVSRRDGILVQAQAAGDFGNADTTPDRAASVAAVARLASLFKG